MAAHSRRASEIATAVLRALSLCAPVALYDPSAAQAQAAESPALTADIPAQSLAQALAAFANQTGLQVVYVSGVVHNKKSHAVSAGLGADAALAQLLQGTGLKVQHLTATSVRILAAAAAAPEIGRSSPAGEESFAEVIVTGTRMATQNEIAVSPIISVSAAEFRETGLTRVEDVLNKLPMFFASTNSTVNNFADGTAALNLRGLGTQRTLVLLDGTRLGPGSADGRNWSDVNQIPAVLVERVDVLTGGASAVYGADAVAGVVNFIINTHFEGVKVDAGYHINQHNNNRDGAASLLNAAGYVLPPSSVSTASGKTASVILGTNFAGSRGNLTGYVTYDNQAATLESKFDYSACSLTPPATPVLACGGSDTSRGGRFTAFSDTGTLFNDTVDPKTGVFRPFAVSEDYNFAPVQYYQVPNERWTGGTWDPLESTCRHASLSIL